MLLTTERGIINALKLIYFKTLLYYKNIKRLRTFLLCTKAANEVSVRRGVSSLKNRYMFGS